METNLILILIVNQIYLAFLPIKDFYINSIFETNKVMEYLIKWVTIPFYAIGFITAIIAIYFFAIAMLNRQEQGVEFIIKKRDKIGVVLFLISITSTAVATILITIFK